MLPIVERELRVASRRRTTYWLRSGLGLAAMLAWLFLLATGRNGIPPAQRGTILFTMVGILSLGFCLLAGVFLTADCLSEERREGTLGLLFLTELRGYDVVCGKLVATSLPALYGLLSILPMLALPLLMGGVTLGEFLRVALVLVVTLAFSLCLGLAVSAFSCETRQAMSATLWMVVVLTGVLPLLEWLCGWMGKGFHPRLFCSPSPAFLYSRCFDTYFGWRGGAREFWTSLLTVGGLAALALAVASVYLPRAWQEAGEGATARESGGWRRRWRFGGESFRAMRRCLLQENPVQWLAGRDRWPVWVASASLSSLFVIWLGFLGGCLSRNRATQGFCFSMSLAVAFGLHLVFKWLVAVESSRRLNEDRRSGALELLLVTPISIEQILEGQFRALSGSFLVPLALTLATNAGLFWLLVGPNPVHMRGEDGALFCELIFGGAVVAASDFYALGWTGMWMGFRAKNHQRAILATLGRIVGLPWLGVVLIYLLGASGAFRSSGAVMMLFLLWHGLSFGLDMVLAAEARSELSLRLRERRAFPGPSWRPAVPAGSMAGNHP